MRENNEGADDASVALLRMLAHSGRVAEAQLDQTLEGANLSLAKWYVLGHLVAAGGSLTLGGIAERLACVKSNVTQLVDRLESEALVRRVHDPLDRRSILAQVTDEGRRRYADGQRSLGAIEQTLSNAYTPAERSMLLELLQRLDRHTG